METRSIAVSMADLNLASTHGARMADSRITKAAKKVCGWMSGSILPATPDYRACFGEALDGARSDLNTLIQAQRQGRSEEHTSELQSLMRISYAVFCLKKKNNKTKD